MPLKKEPCRNFQRGSCRYGDNCKFLHVTQQQQKSNVFGFGSQNATSSQQQKPNPFGFGVQNSGPNGAPKPFENKWVRTEQPSNQSQTANHKCTDPDSCKRLIAEDFQNERPMWKLTCYGHNKYLPCDITGDVSYEELRALAYDDAKRGTSLQSIVERERNLVNSKQIEFQNLLQNPYTKHNPAVQSNQNSFSAVGGSSPFPTQNSGPSPFHQSSSPNMSFGVRPSTPSNTGFGQFQGNPSPFGSNSIPSGPFGAQVPAQTGGVVPNSLSFGTSSINSQVSHFPQQTSGNTFTPQGTAFSNFGASNQSPQVPTQTGGVPFTSNFGGFGNSGSGSQGSQTPATFPISSTQTPIVNNTSMLFNGAAANGFQQTVDHNQQEASATDASIWLKAEWKVGEIPEQPPPPEYVR